MHNRPLAAGYCQLLGRTEVAMKASDVVIGGTYVVKVSDKLAKVRIASAHASGKGWVGKNLETGRQVRIKSPQRLRAEVKDGRPEAPTAPQGARVAKRPEGKGKDAKGQKKKATRANTARERRERTGREAKGRVPKGCDAEGAHKPARPGKTSGLDAAAKVLAEAGEPLSCKQIVERVLAAGLWTTQGRTPTQTIYSAVSREIQNKGETARFRKADPGKFELAR